MQRTSPVEYVGDLKNSSTSQTANINPPQSDREYAAEIPMVVLMAGGFGKRLGDLTRNTPKPLVPVNGRPIVETIIRRFARHGASNFVVTLHYLGDKIRQTLKDGSSMGVEIEYVEETTPLGTAGSLGLITNWHSDKIIVSNADLLTRVNLESIVTNHQAEDADMTVCTTDHEVQVPFGQLVFEDGQVQQIVEKPVYRYPVSAGIYVINRSVIEKFVETDTYLDMPDLITRAIAAENKVIGHKITEQWLDIGRPSDLTAAQEIMKNEELAKQA